MYITILKHNVTIKTKIKNNQKISEKLIFKFILLDIIYYILKKSIY